jgi:hypothetical protein
MSDGVPAPADEGAASGGSDPAPDIAPICKCPRCGRSHRKYPFGPPPGSIFREETGIGVIELDDETIKLRLRQLDDMLAFQNALVEAADMPEDLTPDQVTPWFVDLIRRARRDKR